MNLLVSQATQLLAEGAVIAFPTETVYALACDATNVAAVDKLYALKGRNLAQPIAVLVGAVEKISAFAEMSEAADRLASYYMPGALTLIVPLKSAHGLASNLNKNVATIGVRIPDHSLALDILAHYPNPIAATSANPSGAVPAKTAAEIRAYFGTSVPLILESRAPMSGAASTVLDLTQSPPKIVRQGPIGVEELGKLVAGVQ